MVQRMRVSWEGPVATKRSETEATHGNFDSGERFWLQLESQRFEFKRTDSVLSNVGKL